MNTPPKKQPENKTSRRRDPKSRRAGKPLKHLPGYLGFSPDLPINQKKDEIIQAIKEHQVLIIAGETGSGKTTQIPKFCIAAGRGKRAVIGCTQPRRIAAITVAQRIASEMNQPLGQSVGYKIRFDDKAPKSACIKLMTDGVLLAETQTDKMLRAYDTIIVDEAHERSLNIDFTLGILRQLIKKRKDLKLIITSATIDTEKFSQAFDNAPIIEVSGRMFPVELIYAPLEEQGNDDGDEDEQGYVEVAAGQVISLLSQTGSGDILVFMPTEQDITETIDLIQAKEHPGVRVLPLFARLPAKDQAKVFSTSPGRKVVVSTNVAETSLTIPGIKYVVDTGLARIPSYSPRTRTTALPVRPISQSSANQRTGRCGRVENGICIRLYSEDDFSGRPFFTAPEILRSNLAEVILRMISLNLGDVTTFPFVDPPPVASIKDGFTTLIELGAIEDQKKKSGKTSKKEYQLTPMGRIMADLPIDPKLSRVLLQAKEYRCLEQAMIISTALSVSDIRQRPADKAQAADQQHAFFKDPSSDFITLLNIWDACAQAQKKEGSKAGLRKFCKEHFLSFKRLREWQDIHNQMTKMLRESKLYPATKRVQTTGTRDLKAKEFTWGGQLYIDIHKSLLTGYLSHIARKKEKNTYTAAKGQQAMIFPGSGLYNKSGDWILAAEFIRTSQLFARTVANIDPAWIEEKAGKLCSRTYSSPRWHKKRGEVMASEQVSLFGLILVGERTCSYGKINPEESGDIFIRQALIAGDSFMEFPFMKHNQEVISSVETLEHKIRTRDLLASEDDMFLFYKQKLPRPFFNIRTFAAFLKKQGNDDFLRMTREELQKTAVDEEVLNNFPDQLHTDHGSFPLEYHFEPGKENDGVTIHIPAAQATQIPRHQLDKLVPGLFAEKIAALIKNLPKEFRVRLMPVQNTAAIIARELSQKGQKANETSDQHLFSLLSRTIKEHFKVVIPAAVWSDKGLPDHLKIRVAVKDEKGRQIKALRDLSLLGEFAATQSKKIYPTFEAAVKNYGKKNITGENFPDIEPFVEIPGQISDKNGKLQEAMAFPGLAIKDNQINLTLFPTKKQAEASHQKAVGKLFEQTHSQHFKAMEKQIRECPAISRGAVHFNGKDKLVKALYQAMFREHFEKNIRSQKEFTAHGMEMRKQLYSLTEEYTNAVSALIAAYDSCYANLKQLSLKYANRPQASGLLAEIYQELQNLVPAHFPELYSMERIRELPRYVACLDVRARKACENPGRETRKSALVLSYQKKLDALVSSLTPDSSSEKAQGVEDCYWLLEEYKISVYAQEIGTKGKISQKRLDKIFLEISMLV